MMIAVLRAAGINHLIAVDGSASRLEMAKKLGVKTVINFREADTLEKRVAAVKAVTNGMGADFAYQCTCLLYTSRCVEETDIKETEHIVEGAPPVELEVTWHG